MLGTWKDEQVPNTYSHYADMVMETLMMKVYQVRRNQNRSNVMSAAVDFLKEVS